MQLQHVVRDGLAVGDSSIVFSLNTASELQSTDTGIRLGFVGIGDIFLVKNGTLDMALWRIGGTAIALRLVQLANVRGFLPLTCTSLTAGGRVTISYREPLAFLPTVFGIAGKTLRTSSDFVSAAHILSIRMTLTPTRWLRYFGRLAPRKARLDQHDRIRNHIRVFGPQLPLA